MHLESKLCFSLVFLFVFLSSSSHCALKKIKNLLGGNKGRVKTERKKNKKTTEKEKIYENKKTEGKKRNGILVFDQNSFVDARGKI
mmetsp:Transcript_49653/g.56959  ORF Transcript_49653/g.56959 Transcript_49653/m.56959 type:complete len:86 (+) Transcript_49653:5-262(+)